VKSLFVLYTKRIIVFALLLAAAEPAAKPIYFARVRQIYAATTSSQNYFVVDPDLWAHARPGLADLRIYSADTQIPYALTAEETSTSTEQHEARILNLGAVGVETHFDLDMQGLPEYDRVQLRLSAMNFVATAGVDGRESLDMSPSTALASSTIYDFSRERLGSSFVLHLAPSTFRYLHVRISQGVQPGQVLGAEVSLLHESKAAWSRAGTCAPPEPHNRETIVTCELFPGAPLARLLFDIPGASFNFRRTVTVSDDKGDDLVRSSISRIRMEKAHPPVLTEELALRVPCGACNPEQRTLRVAIDNGDDTPLPGVQVVPEALERRVYFDPQGRTDLRLYYGDEKLGAPVYDFAKFFKPASDAVLVTLGAETGTGFPPRPDDRPWSERHPAFLWIVLLMAVVTLAAIALRSMMNASAPKSN